ncbi:MAG: hypothetical protein J5504_07075, partial [Butyrivibrio sp.]|nr:hypothetical protein [Butyrivibrio sp.]
FGVFTMDDIWEEIKKGWNDNTTRSYLTKYISCVFPRLQEKPLKEYTKDDYENVLNSIRNELREQGRKYHKKQMHRFEYWIRVVTKAANKLYPELFPDPLWGSRFQINEKKVEDKVKLECVRLIKSLSIGEEIRIFNKLMKDPKQKGVFFGLALMFCLGLRNQEAVAVSFGDIYALDDENYYILIYKTAAGDTRGSKLGGKTKNAIRKIPIPKHLKRLLDERKKYLCEILGKTEKEISKYPIACKEGEYTVQCKPSELTTQGSQLLREVKVSENMLAFMDEDIEREREIEPGVFEKDPTAYLFRRNLATHLYILGLTHNEIRYIMGHDIEDEDDERNFIGNEDRLKRIAEKMKKRPLVNDEKQDEFIVNQHCVKKDVYNAKFHIDNLPASADLHIVVKQREPHSKTEIQFGDTIDGVYYYCTPNADEYAQTVNVLTTYIDRYKKKIEKDQLEKEERIDSNMMEKKTEP